MWGMKYLIVRHTLIGTEHLEEFDTRDDAEKAVGIYRRTQSFGCLGYEVLECSNFYGMKFIADPQVPEGWIIPAARRVVPIFAAPGPTE